MVITPGIKKKSNIAKESLTVEIVKKNFLMKPG